MGSNEGNVIYTFILPQIVFLFIELITTWIAYSYSKSVGMGKDALADGQSFDRYAENLAPSSSSDNSRRSSPRNSERSFHLEDNFNSNLNVK